MDQKRTVIIILSICVVAVVVTVVALWLLYPRNVASQQTGNGTNLSYVQGLDGSPGNGASGSTGQTGNGVQQTDGSVNENGTGVTGMQTGNANPEGSPDPNGNQGTPTQTQTQNLLIVYGTNPTYKTGPDGTLIRVDGTSATEVIALPSASPAAGGTKPAAVLGNPENGNAAQGDTASPERAASTAGSQSGSRAAADSTARNQSSTSRQNTAQSQSASASRTQPAPAPQQGSVSGTEYWIQIISSPNRDRVDQVRRDLAVLGFNGRVSTKGVNGIDYFRLRYGPYSRQDEAQKFLDWVKVIRGFEASYIAEEYPR